MATRSITRIPDHSTLIVEHHGLLWKPTTDATVSLEEFLSAKARFIQIMDDHVWNPWNQDSHAPELSSLEGILDQWTRAEPGFRPLTNQEFEQRCEQRRTQREAEQAEQARQREARKKQYDPTREAARLELLENESLVRHGQTELAKLRDGTRFPTMDSRRRAEEITALEQSLDNRLARLRDQVGDVETVVDANGALPEKRCEAVLSMFGTSRSCQVAHVRERLDHLDPVNNARQACEDQTSRRAVPPVLRTSRKQVAVAAMTDQVWTPTVLIPCRWP